MNFICECGSKEFHTFFHYSALNKERFRCKNCNKTYQRDGNQVKEIDLKKIWGELRSNF